MIRSQHRRLFPESGVSKPARFRLISALALATTVLALYQPALAQTLPSRSIDPTNNGIDVDPNGRFGQTLAITPDKDRIIAGVPGNDEVAVFDDGPGGFQETLQYTNLGEVPVAAGANLTIVGYTTGFDEQGIYSLADNGNVGDFLVQGLDAPPEALAIRPGLIAVGMPSYANSAGRVRVYHYNSEFDIWLSASPLDGDSAGDRLGASLAFTSTGAFLLAGAPMAGANGEVEMFFDASGTWVDYQTVTPPPDFDSQSGARFGASIAVDGDWLAVGAPLANRIFTGIGVPAFDGGIVSLFEFDFLSYVHRQRFQGSIDDANVGAAVAMSSTIGNSKLLVVGAPGEGNNRTGRARAYALGGSGNWVFQETLEGAGLREGDEFGTTIASVGRMVVIGAPFWDYCAPGAPLCSSAVGIALIYQGVGVLFEDGFESGNTSQWSATQD